MGIGGGGRGGGVGGEVRHRARGPSDKAAVAILGMYGVVYFGVTYWLRVEECAGALRRVARLRR